MQVVHDQGFGATTTDFTAQIFRMKNAGVRFLIVTGDTGSYAKILQAANQKDFPLLEAGVLVIGAVYMVATLTADILFTLLNPRIRYRGVE